MKRLLNLQAHFKTALLLAFALVTLIHAETAEEMLNTPIPEYEPRLSDMVVSNAVCEMLSKYHYDAHPISVAVSSKWFNEYLKNLDYQHIYFLQSDIDEFRKYETTLWNQDRHAVNVPAAYRIYERLLQRVKERAQFVLAEIDRKQDFSVKEYVTIDRKDALPPSDKNEQQDLWRKLLKNEILVAMFETEDEAADFASGKKKADEERKTLEERLEEIRKNHARTFKRRAEKEQIEVFGTFLTSLALTYDPHSIYNTPFNTEDFDIRMRLSLQGIGATLSIEGSYVVVVEVVSGGAADRDGRLKKDDRIVAVAQDGKEPVDVVDMSLNKVVQMIRGPKGTKVHLTILPKGSRKQEQITIVRDEIKLKDDEAKSEIKKITLDDGSEANVLFMRLPSFYCDFASKFAGKEDYKSTTKDMLALLQAGKEAGKLDGVVLDMRGNGGGALEEVISLAGLFVDSSPVVQVRDVRGIKVREEKSPMRYAGPLILMVDRLSASATEIMASALQDQGRAIVVGDKRTHGKGTVQNTFDLKHMIRVNLPEVHKKEFGSLNITIGKFYRINGGSTQIKGVEPDIVFEYITDHMELGEERLDYVLPWDEIPPAQYNTYTEAKSVLPKLKAASEKRRAESPLFQLYHKNIENYEKVIKLKEIPLEINERREFKKSQDEADKMVKEFRDLLDDKKSDDKEKKEKRDIVLEETFNIMKDYIQ
ncbi:MAG: carboxy terminal-processing peptidase, partial [Victivallales bacterium]|nr:carboxy terminal-processing peptidase [Victivallales bacterium]